MQLPELPPAPRARLIRLAFAVLALASALLAAACIETRLNRALKTPDQTQTLDHRSAYLKMHMKDGQLYLLSKWRVDDAAREVSGEGERFGFARETMESGSFALALDDVALLETNVPQRSPSAAALAVITDVSVAVTVFCIENPKACFGSCPTFYVSDGKDAVLQAEGFSSSVAPSLEARDVDALYRVHPDGREFIVTMKNEALETHVVRHVRLLGCAGTVLTLSSGSGTSVLGRSPPVAVHTPPRPAMVDSQGSTCGDVSEESAAAAAQVPTNIPTTISTFRSACPRTSSIFLISANGMVSRRRFCPSRMVTTMASGSTSSRTALDLPPSARSILTTRLTPILLTREAISRSCAPVACAASCSSANDASLMPDTDAISSATTITTSARFTWSPL